MLNYSASPVNLFESEVDPSRDVCASRMETGKQKGMPEDVDKDIRAVAIVMRHATGDSKDTGSQHMGAMMKVPLGVEYRK